MSMARRPHDVDSSAARASISAGLEQIQRRQELLAHGDVSPRLRTPLLATRESDWPSASSTATTTANHLQVLLSRDGGRVAPHGGTGNVGSSGHSRQTREHRHPTTTSKADPIANTVAHTQRIQWVRKPVQKLHLQHNTTDDVGTIEFATIASLAGVRQLIDQFYPVPNRREYKFYHPTLRVYIKPSDEENVLPWDFPTILFVVLPLPPRPRPAPVLSSEFGLHTKSDLTAATTTRVTTPSGRNMKQLRAVHAAPAGAMDARAAALTAQPAAYRDLLFPDRIVSGTRCDVAIRDFHSKDVVGIRARIKEGVFMGRSTIIKRMNWSDLASLLDHSTAIPTSNEGASIAATSMHRSTRSHTRAVVSNAWYPQSSAQRSITRLSLCCH